MGRLILAINPGSTSTKFSLFEEDKLLFENTLRHSADELKGYTKITDQFHFRKDLIMQELTERNTDFKRIRAVVGRGGLLKPVESGVYEVNSRMIQDLATGHFGQHASNLGGLIAHDLKMFLPDSAAYIVDPVVVDELQDVARISGHPEIERKSIFHALNQKAVARIYAESITKSYDELNLIVAHMGGGISIGAHCKGKVIDVNNAFNGEGPMSPERSGGLPSGQLADLCFSGRFTHDEIRSMITGKGGMVAYLGTNNFIEVSQQSKEGNKKAELIKKAIAYQIGKEIGSAAAVLNGKVDAIILTGGLAHDKENNEIIASMVNFIARVVIYPGEDEMKSLAYNGLLAIDGKVEVKQYN